MPTETNSFLTKIREEYPQYEDIDDIDLAKAYRKKHYSDFEEDVFLDKIGMHQNSTLEDVGDYFGDIDTKSLQDGISAGIDRTVDTFGNAVDNVFASTQNDSVVDTVPTSDVATPDIVAQTPDEELPTPEYPINNPLPTSSIDLNAPDKKLDVQFKEEHDDSNIVDQIQSSLLKQSKEAARAITKFGKRGLEYIGADVLNSVIPEIESLSQEDADFIVGYSRANRVKDKASMEDIKKDWDNNDFASATAKSVLELPSVLADSSGEIVQLINLPSTALAISARVSKYEDEFIANNDGNTPDSSWYAEAIVTQTVILLGEKLGLKVLGKTLKSTKPKTIAGVGGGLVVAGGSEGLQEYSEAVSEEHLTQTVGAKTLGEIASSDNAKFSAFMGVTAGTSLKGTAEVGSVVFNKLTTQAKTEQREAFVKELLIQDNYNKQMMGIGLVMQTNDIEYQNFTTQLDEKVSKIQEEFTNLIINNPDLEVPVEAIDSIIVQEQVIEEAKAKGLDTSSNNGLNAIDSGFKALEQEIGVLDEDMKPFASEDPVVGEPEPEAKDTIVDVARLKELEEQPFEDLTQDEKFELEDLQEPMDLSDINIGDDLEREIEIESPTIEEPIVIEKPVVGEPEPEAKIENATRLYEDESPDIQTENIKLYQSGKKMTYTDSSGHKQFVTISSTDTQSKHGKNFVGVSNESGSKFGVMVSRLSLIEPENQKSLSTTFEDLTQDEKFELEDLQEPMDLSDINIGDELKRDIDVVEPVLEETIIKDKVEDEINPAAAQTEVMFKKPNGKKAVRGELIDLDYGLKGVIVSDGKGSFSIHEYLSGSRFSGWGEHTSWKKDEAIAQANKKLAGFGEEKLNSIIESARADGTLINPEIIYAKPKVNQDTTAPKKGQVEFTIQRADNSTTTAYGYPIKLAEGYNGFVKKDNEGTSWAVTEKDSGLIIGNGKTRTNAIADANARVLVAKDKMPTFIKDAIKDREQALLEAEKDKYEDEALLAYGELDSNAKFTFNRAWLSDVLADDKVYEFVDKKPEGTFKRVIVEQYLKDNHSFDKYKNSDIIDTEVQDNGQQSSDDTIGETSNGTSDTVGVPTSEQATPDIQGSQGSDSTVPNSDRRPDGLDNDGSIETELSTNDERVGGLQSPKDNQLNEQQTTNADTVLPKPNDSEVYSLEGKTPVELTKGQRKKFNAQALEIIKKPLEEITQADREILRHYTGEGGLGEVSENSINQHYTNYETVSAMTKALSNAGIPIQKVLEPAVGSGNFVGFNPNASWDVIDIDTTNIEVTSRIYPQINNFHAESYETFKGKNYDLIISNVPFASEQMLMREHAMTIKPAFKAIHNFYFAHSIDKVKDNGVVAFMTSTGTMDGTTTAKSLRKYLMDRGDIIGAYRLPEKSQAKNAHTDTMIDIIFIQKRPAGVESRQVATNNQFINIGSKDGHAMNEYFIANPESLLGDTVVIDKDKTKMGKEGWIVRGVPKLENIKLTYEPYAKLKKSKEEINEFQYVVDGIAYADNNGLRYKIGDTKPSTDLTDLEMIHYDTLVTFISSEETMMFGQALKGTNANKALHLQRIMTLTEDALSFNDKGLLNTALGEIKSYEAIFTKSPHNDLGLKKFMRQNRVDVKLKEFMSYFDKDFNPAPVYSEETRFKNSGELDINAKSPLLDRALFYSSIDATIDTTKVYEFMGAKDLQQLQEDGTYIKSDTNKIELAFMYYGGNIYKKLDNLENLLASGNIDKSRYALQHKKLMEIVPKPTAFKNIKVRGNESWLPSAVKDKLLNKRTGELEVNPDVFDGNWTHVRLYNRYLNKVALVPKKKDDSDAENIQATMDAEQLLNEILKPKIMNFIESEQLQEMMSDSYNRNSNFFVRPQMNGTLLRNLPKSFRGKKFSMQGHQLEGAEILVYNKKGVLAFAPGGGKTITAIVAVKNLLEQGVMKKPLFVVPVNTIAQWEETVRELYPDATVFEFPKVKSGKNKGNAKEWSQLSREEKEQMAFDLANNRYDFTIIGDTMFQKFGLPNDVLSDYVDDLVAQMVKAEESQDGDSTKKKKEIVSAEKKRKALKVGLRQAYGGDVAFNFAKLGFDGLIADEVQYYKNIGMQGSDAKGGLGATLAIKYYDKNSKVITTKDIKDGAEPHSATLGSMRSYDFRFKSKYVSQNNNGNNVILLTGTPTPNKPLELYTLLQHLDEDILKEYGIESSTDFVDTFYDLENYETTDATGKIVKREGLSSIKNLDWLGNILDRYVNYKGFEDMPDLPRPKQVDVQHYLDLSKAGEVIFGDIQHRLLQSIENAKEVKRGGMSQDDVEGQLVAQGVARGASIDLRLYDVGTKGKSSLTSEVLEELIENDVTTSKNNKILKTVELIEKEYKENSNSGQIIFLDRLTVKNSDGTTTSTHEEIRAKVLATGLFNENEVVFVNGDKYVNPTTGKVANKIKPDMLNKIMDNYNAGKIKVIIGNTAKLGVGVDLNKKTTDIYQIDIPYRPDEIEQRNNRGVRQGNENAEVRVHQFFQIGTFDKRSYDIVLAKRGFNDIYGFSDNNDVEFEDGVSQISNKNTTDPYQAIIDLEKDPFVRERLRKQRMVDNAVVDENDLKNIVEKIKSDIGVKQGSRKNYEEAIKSSQRQQLPENLPEYKNVKDDVEKKERTETFVKQLQERVTKYETTIEGIDAELILYDKKLLERNEQRSRHEADTKFVTDEFTKDGKNVDLELIKNHFTELEILESEDGSGDIASVSAMRVPQKNNIEIALKNLKKEIDANTLSDEETNSYARANGYDEAGINYIPTYATTGVPARPADGRIAIGTKIVQLPTLEKPMNADSLRVYVTAITGNRLYEAKIKGKSALGVYKRNDSAIRVKNYSDIEVLAHEMAHYLDFFHNNKTKDAKGSFFRLAMLKNKDEVKALSYTTDPKNVIKEGFAEFVRLYLSNYNALNLVAPNMVKDFEKKLAQDKVLQKNMLQLQEGIHQYYFQGEHSMLRSKRGGELNSVAKKIKRSQAEIARDMRQKTIDSNHAFKRIEAEVNGDIDKDAANSPYKALQMVNGASSIMHSVMNFGVPTVLENGDISYSGKAINEIFKPATKVGIERVRLLEDYLVAKRASELMAQGRENLITEDEIQAGLALDKLYPEFETIFNEYQAFNDSMLDFYVDMKLITTSQRESFEEMNKNYVPFNRITESVQFGEVPPSKIGQRLTGGTHSLGNIMENIIDGIESNIKLALVSRGKSLFYEMLEESGMGGVYATKISTDSKLVKDDLDAQASKVATIMASMGITITKDGMVLSGKSDSENFYDIDEIKQNLMNNPKTLDVWTHGHAPTSVGGYVDSVIINDKKVYFETHDTGLVDSITSFNGTNYNLAIQAMMSVKNIMTWNITNNPLFYLTNFMRDTVSAGVLSKNGFIPVLSSISGMYHFITKSKVFKDYMASGAGYGTRRTALGADIKAQRMLEVNRGFEVLTRLVDALEYGADIFEYGTRVGEFNLAQKNGKSNTQSAFEAREISTDFAIKGSNNAFAGFMSTVPFMKAGVLGIDKTARRIFSLNGEMKFSNAAKFRNQLGELQTHKIKIYIAGGIIAGATLALWMQNRDDERYKKLTRDSKLMYWHFFVGDTHYKIPRPYDIGFAFATIPEIIADGIYTKHGKEAAKEFTFGVKTMFSIGDISGLFQPILEDMTNKNWRGSPIIPNNMQNIDDLSDQYFSTTPLMYKEAGELTGLSPLKMKHYINGYLGLTSKMVEEATEKMLWNKKEWGERAFERNALEFLVYRFKAPEVEPRTKYSEKYYELMQKANGIKASYDKKRSEAVVDKGADIKEYMSDKEKGAYVSISKALKKYNKTLTAVKNGVEMTKYDKTKSKKQKEDIINKAYLDKTELFKTTIEGVEKALKQFEEK